MYVVYVCLSRERQGLPEFDLLQAGEIRTISERSSFLHRHLLRNSLRHEAHAASCKLHRRVYVLHLPPRSLGCAFILWWDCGLMEEPPLLYSV